MRYPESIRINVGFLPDATPEMMLSELELAGLYDVKPMSEVRAVIGSVASKEWLDNIVRVEGVEYAEKQAPRYLARVITRVGEGIATGGLMGRSEQEPVDMISDLSDEEIEEHGI